VVSYIGYVVGGVKSSIGEVVGGGGGARVVCGGRLGGGRGGKGRRVCGAAVVGGKVVVVSVVVGIVATVGIVGATYGASVLSDTIHGMLESPLSGCLLVGRVDSCVGGGGAGVVVCSGVVSTTVVVGGGVVGVFEWMI